MQQSIKFLATYISRKFWLFFAVFLLSFHQATILAYGDFGYEAVGANLAQLDDAYIPNSLVLNYLGKVGLGEISFKIIGYAIPLFLAQSVPAVMYGHFNSIRSKRRAALAIWLLPAILGLPTLGATITYLMSPVFAIFTYPAFIFVFDIAGQTHKEDFAEGLVFTIGVIGWFHIFWLAVTIKTWFFPRHQFNKIV